MGEQWTGDEIREWADGLAVTVDAGLATVVFDLQNHSLGNHDYIIKRRITAAGKEVADLRKADEMLLALDDKREADE